MALPFAIPAVLLTKKAAIIAGASLAGAVLGAGTYGVVASRSTKAKSADAPSEKAETEVGDNEFARNGGVVPLSSGKGDSENDYAVMLLLFENLTAEDATEKLQEVFPDLSQKDASEIVSDVMRQSTANNTIHLAMLRTAIQDAVMEVIAAKLVTPAGVDPTAFSKALRKIYKKYKLI